MIVVIVSRFLLLRSLFCSFHNLLVFKELPSGKLLQLLFLPFLLKLFILHLPHFFGPFQLFLLFAVLINQVSLPSDSVPFIVFFQSSLNLLRHFTIFLILSLDFSLLLLFSSLLLHDGLLSLIVFSEFLLLEHFLSSLVLFFLFLHRSEPFLFKVFLFLFLQLFLPLLFLLCLLSLKSPFLFKFLS